MAGCQNSLGTVCGHGMRAHLGREEQWGLCSEVQAGDTAEVRSTLTVIRPAGVQEVVPVRREGHIQDTPAYVPSLDAFELVEAAIPTVIQSDCLICREGIR